tara:strand:- start:13 stop:219 length:207 start_codon:yes stop_codon:yes gene_type:complete
MAFDVSDVSIKLQNKFWELCRERRAILLEELSECFGRQVNESDITQSSLSPHESATALEKIGTCDLDF